MQSKENFIVSISAVPFPYGSASDNIIYTFMDGFQEHGCKGEVVCLFQNMPKAHWDVPTIGEYKSVKYRYICGAGRYNRYLRYIVNRLINTQRAKSQLHKYLRKKTEQYNVIAVVFGHVGKYLADIFALCKSLDVRVVMTACEYPQYLIKTTPYKEEQFKILSRNIDKYIFETKTLEDYHKNILGSIESVVVPPTLPFEDILDCYKSTKERYIAYCGSIHSEAKDGLSNILKAFSIAANTIDDVNLKFIGKITKPAYYQELLSLVKDLGLEGRVFFSGEVERNEYVKFLANAELLMVAKPTDSYYGGGLSSKIIEYLFSGNPVLMVASDDYVNYLSHKENVYFVPDNLPQTLANAIVELYSDNELRHKIAEGGKTFAMNRFNYHILTSELLEFILS